MNIWPRRIHLLTTVGGGFTGLAIGLATLIGGLSTFKFLEILLVSSYCALCIWSITVGLRLSEGRDVHRELRILYVIQIPYLASPVVSFHAGFAFMLYVGSVANGENLQAKLGADWAAGILSGDSWAVAMNLVPILMLWLLRRHSDPQQ